MILKGKHLCWSLFLIKLQAWRSAVLFKKRLHYCCFPANIIKFLRTAFCMEHLRWLFLKMVEFLRNCISIRGICTKEFIRNPRLCFNSLRRDLYRGIYNLGQVLGDTFTKLSKKGFSMDCFTADFLRLFTKNGQNLALLWAPGYSPSNPGISEIFKSFGNSWGNSNIHSVVIII